MNKIFKLIFCCTAYSGLAVNAMNSRSTLLQQQGPIEKMILSLDEVDVIVNENLEAFNVPGFALGIVVDNQIIFTRGYGTRKVNEELSVSEHTLFPIGSCTKAFTALMLGQLVEEGLVDWDDRVRKYIPEFSVLNQNTTTHLTIRDLLAHRTGMARHDSIWIFSDISRSDIIGILKKLEPQCELREEFQYNNFMYSIAGIIIERVTGQSWEEAIKQRIFDPLKMKDTNVSIQQLTKSSDYSSPHAENNGLERVLSFRNLYPCNPGGGINSNVIDMTKWVALNLSQGTISNEKIIDSQTLREMYAIQMPFPQSPQLTHEVTQRLGYGLGWLIGKYRGYNSVSHGGDIDGFSSEVFMLPAEKIGLVILTNSSSDGRYAALCTRNQVIDKILGFGDIDWKAKIQETRVQNKQAIQIALQSFYQQNEKIDKQVMEGYLGQFQHPAYGSVKISIENDLLLFSYGQLSIPLSYKSEDVFTCQSDVLISYGINPIMDLLFLRNSSGDIDRIQIPFEGFRQAKPITFVRKI